MKPFKFTPAEYQAAKELLSLSEYDRYQKVMIVEGNVGTICLDYSKPLWPPRAYSWAAKCVQWWERFHTVMKRYARIMGSLALATKAVWLNISRGISLPKMLRQLANPAGFVPEPKKWQKPRFPREDTKRNGPAITYIRPKTNKHERRIKCTNIANRLQSC